MCTLTDEKCGKGGKNCINKETGYLGFLQAFGKVLLFRLLIFNTEYSWPLNNAGIRGADPLPAQSEIHA